jgi:hypothetical protein
MKDLFNIPEATIWINSKHNGPPIQEHDIIRLINAGRLAAYFEYDGYLGIYEPGTPPFTDREQRHRSAPIAHFKFSGILEIIDGCDLREETENTPSGPESLQGFRTFLVGIRNAWEPIPEDIPEDKDIRPFGPHGAAGTIKDVLIAYSDLVSCFPSLGTDTPQKDGRITGKREDQIQAIERAAKELGYPDPLSLPTGAKAAIKSRCIEWPVFGYRDSSFTRAWREANEQDRIRLAEKEKFMG